MEYRMKKTIKILSILFIGLIGVNNSSYAASAQMGPCDEQVCVDYFKQYKKYAKLGYADAMVTLAEMYYYGHGTKQSLKKAMKQYRSSAKWGSVKGQYKTGIMYLNEEEIKDVEEGVKYLKKAARKNHVTASLLLGIIYSSEKYFEQDLSEADKWLTKAYKKKHEKAAAYVEYLKSTDKFTAKNFPDLTKEVAANPIEVATVVSKTSPAKSQDKDSNAQQAAKKDDVEVITVYGSLPDLLDAQLASLRNTYPEKHAQNTGSNIIGKNCAQTLSCGLTHSEDFVRLTRNIMGHQAVLKFKSEGIGW
jgi:hypothetical protein